MFSTTESPEARQWDSERRNSPYSTVCDPNEDDYCEACDSAVDYSDGSKHGRCNCDEEQPGGCSCPPSGRLEDCVDCPLHGADAWAELAAIQQSEIDAEYAWLRAAEAPTAEDYAFEAWEAERGLF